MLRIRLALGVGVAAVLFWLLAIISPLRTQFFIGGGVLSGAQRDLNGIVGLLGTLATLVALWIAVEQIAKTDSIAKAAADGYKRATTDLREMYWRFAAAKARRLLTEANDSVQPEDWRHAAV